MSYASSSYVIILAGGIGKRFQPYSTPECPKQFLNITSESRTMIQETYDRVTAFVDPDHLLVSTNDRYIDLVARQLPKIPRANIIGEPKKKNTAPAIALITHLIHKRDPQAVTVFLPSDHFIAAPEKAVATFKLGIERASAEPVLVTFGIVPTFASPEFGYIHRGAAIQGTDAYRVDAFVEKPDIATAERYIASGEYFWNGGMFAWKTATLIDALRKHCPHMAKLADDITLNGNGMIGHEWLADYFERVEEISIDYAIMEKTDNACVFPFDCGWSDVGTWRGLHELTRRFDLKLPPVVERFVCAN